MFEDELSSQGGPGQPKATSSVVGMVTGGTTWSRRSLRDQNPKKMYEEVGTTKIFILPSLISRCLIEFIMFVTQSMMSRRVKQYLSNLTIIQDEEKLRDMSNVCEPPQGSGELTMSFPIPSPSPPLASYWPCFLLAVLANLIRMFNFFCFCSSAKRANTEEKLAHVLSGRQQEGSQSWQTW